MPVGSSNGPSPGYIGNQTAGTEALTAKLRGIGPDLDSFRNSQKPLAVAA
ncbi:MAG: hypothetical protein HQ518_15680 [Rhodopirellula sp.]|nr:hypothetical protein [Rhodopirellula sp.]